VERWVAVTETTKLAGANSSYRSDRKAGGAHGWWQTRKHEVPMESATEKLEIVFDPLPGEDLTRFVSDNVVNLNFAKTGISAWHPVNFFLKHHRGEWLGGLTGYLWGGWMHVNFLWVTESLRGQGHGTRLMDAAEAFARERGAGAVTLETHSFQAPGFYAKRGYSVFGRLDDYPPGHAKLFLSKRLDA
jgi:GNAT superfamily N-acetyltransferase